jgi:hypothetical protein
VCTEEFDVDDFQRLQPGLDLQFFLNLQEEKEKREQRHNLESETSVRAPVRSESSNEVIEIREENAVIRANPVIQVRSHKRGETCIYSSSANDGKCLICKEEHFDCNFIAEHRCSTCYKTAEGCPISASKASYVIEKLLQLRKNDGKGRSNISMQAARVFANGSNHRPLKAIVFSEFRDVYVRLRRRSSTCSQDEYTLPVCLLTPLFYDSTGILRRPTCPQIWSKFYRKVNALLSLLSLFTPTNTSSGYLCG